MNKSKTEELAYVGKNCEDPRVNAYYVGIHAISEKRYEAMIRKYFGLKRPDEKKIPKNALDLTAGCLDHAVLFDVPEKVNNNDEINVKVGELKQFDGKYSIHFFRGLNAFFAPAEYQFSKAIGAKGKTLVVRIVNAQGEAVYHGDLTHMYP